MAPCGAASELSRILFYNIIHYQVGDSLELMNKVTDKIAIFHILLD